MTHRQTILAVDDAPESLALLATLLAEDGYTMHPADSGELALESALAAPPSLVLLDLRMPGLSGLDVLRRLKGEASTADVPVILVSGAADTGEWVEGLQLGAADYISKPFQAAELRTRVRTQLALAAARRIVAEQTDALRLSAERLRAEQEDRVRAQTSLSMRDAYYLEQFDRNLLVSLLVDTADARIVGANPAAVRFYGWSRDDLLTRRISDINVLGPEASRERIASVLSEGGQRFETRHRMADGSTRAVMVAASPVQFGGRVVLQSFVQDLTDQRRAEAALRESEARYRSLVELMPDAVLVSRDRLILYANAALARMVGARTPEALVGTSVETFLHPDYAAASEARRRQVVESGEQAPQREAHFLRLNGEAFHAETASVPLELEGHAAVLTVVRDITERKRAEAALRESEAKYRLLTENVKDVVWVLDAESRRLDYISPSVERLLGYRPEELVGQSAGILLPDDAAPYVRELIEGRTAELRAADHPAERFYTEQLEQRRRDGSTVPVEVITSYYVEEGSGRVKVRGVTRDITERRQGEAERARLTAHLQQAQKMESVGRLAGGIAHDFNNMLSVILGNVELALGDLDPASQLREDLLEVQRAARHSADITRQLLAYARQQTVSPTAVDLNQSVPKSLSLLRPLLGEEVQVEWLPGPSLWPVTMDPSQLDQIVTNLCVNARDAIAGMGRLTLSTRNVSIAASACEALHEDAVPGDHVRLRVSDDGQGMSREVMARIFDPFFTTKGVGEGTGLGLATVYGAVRQNHGFVTVASVEGRGSTFDIYLPRRVAAVAEPSAHVPPTPASRGQGLVLLVEDEPAILRLATRVLAAQGYSVLGARDPAEAVRLAAGHVGEIRLLLTDVVMPEMNGRQLADLLHATHPHMACLFMSGYTGVVLSDHGVGDDAHFIAKPFSLQALAAKVGDILGPATP